MPTRKCDIHLEYNQASLSFEETPASMTITVHPPASIWWKHKTFNVLPTYSKFF
jgi:hypothetical protein